MVGLVLGNLITIERTGDLLRTHTCIHTRANIQSIHTQEQTKYDPLPWGRLLK